MAAPRDRWTCPVCEHRFLYLSELVEHVESRHPADNVTVLEPSMRSPGEVASADPGEDDRVPEPDAGTAVSPAGPDGTGVSGLEPFDDFESAARAVMDEVSAGARRGASAVLLRLLSTIRAIEARIEEPGGAAVADEEADPLIDPRTGLGNRRAWMDALATEEDRCRRHGMGASVVLLRFRGSADLGEVVERTASLVSRQVRAHDTIVRLRDDALGVLAVQCSEADAALLAERMLEVMRTERIPARAAVGARGRRLDLFGAWEEAERRLHHGPPPGAASG